MPCLAKNEFLHLHSSSIPAIITFFGTGEDGFGNSNLTLGLSGDPGIGSLNQYWSIQEEVYDGSHFILVKENPSFTDQIKLVTFNDRKAPSTLSFLSGYGWVYVWVWCVGVVECVVGLLLGMSGCGCLCLDVF